MSLEQLTLRRQATSIRNIRDDPIAIARNILGVDLWPKQEEILRDFYIAGRKELVICAGMRSSKSFLAGLIGAIETVRWLMLDEPWKTYGIIPGQTVYGLITATSEKQAKRTSFMYYHNLIQRSWWFREVPKEVQELQVKFPGKGLEVQAVPSSSASQAGGTLLFVIIDELSRFVDTNGARSGDMVYDVLSRGCKTLRGKVVSISSPLYVRDKIMRLLEEAKKLKADADKQGQPAPIAFYHLATWELNPTLKREDFNEDYARNPETARRDWEAVPSFAVEPYYMEPEKIRLDFSRRNPTIDVLGGIHGLVRNPAMHYYLHGDPAVKNDSFGLALAHLDGKVAVVDLLHRFVPPPGREIDAAMVRKVIENIHAAVKIDMATFDTWNYPETIQALKNAGIKVEILIIKKEQHDHLKERIYADPAAISIPDHALPVAGPTMPETVVGELQELELVKGQKVDHPTGGSKDVADAVAGAVWDAHVHTSTRRFKRIVSG